MRGTRITRRDFLKGASASAALVLGAPYIITSTALGAEGRPPASDRIVMGAIGLGGQGRGNMANLFYNPDVQMVAVCDVDVVRQKVARKQVEDYYKTHSPGAGYKGCAMYGDFRDVLARPDIDAVMIATPDHWHALVAIAAAKAGKDVYCEKPLALTIEQGRAMSDAMARYGRVFQTGSQQRSAENFRFACELVQNGRIGKLHTIEVGIPTGVSTTVGAHPDMSIPPGFDYNMWLGPAPWEPYTKGRCHWNFRYILDYSGGLVTDWGAHHLDIAQWGNGTMRTGPISVEGVGDYPGEGLYNTAIGYRFQCEYANGVKLICWDRFPQGVRFIGPDGWVFVKRGYIDTHPKSLLTSVIEPNEIHLAHSRGHHPNFVDCVRSRAETVAPVEVGHRSVTLCHLGNIAMRMGRKLKWDPKAENFGNDPEANRMLSRPMRAPWSLS